MLFLEAFGPQHPEGGRMQVAGRGWGRTPGAGLGGGARQDGTMGMDDSSDGGHRRAERDSSGHSLHGVHRT